VLVKLLGSNSFYTKVNTTTLNFSVTPEFDTAMWDVINKKVMQPSVEIVNILSATMEYKCLERLDVNKRLAFLAHRLSIFEGHNTTMGLEDGWDDVSDSDSDEISDTNEEMEDMNDWNEEEKSKYEDLKNDWKVNPNFSIANLTMNLGNGWNKRNPMTTNLDTMLLADRIREAKKWRDSYLAGKPRGHKITTEEKEYIYKTFRENGVSV
jgi:hypothetical protein